MVAEAGGRFHDLIDQANISRNISVSKRPFSSLYDLKFETPNIKESHYCQIYLYFFIKSFFHLQDKVI